MPPCLLQAFTCSVCQEVFKRRMELRLHMVSHTGDMPYKVSSACLQHPYRHCQARLRRKRGKSLWCGAPKPPCLVRSSALRVIPYL